MPDLSGKIAVVTGASRGVGRGIAHGLGEAGATVYITGRTVEEGTADVPGTIQQTADEVTSWAGKASPSAATTAMTKRRKLSFSV